MGRVHHLEVIAGGSVFAFDPVNSSLPKKPSIIDLLVREQVQKG